MRNARLFLLGLALSMLVVLLGGFTMSLHLGTKKAQAQQGPVIGVVAAELTSQQVRVEVFGQDLANLGGFEFDLEVDPAVARLEGTQLGDFLASTGRTVGTLGPLLGSQGESLAFGGYSYDPSGQNAPGPSGDGTMAVITLTVAGDGLSPLALADPLLVDVEANVQAVATADAALHAKTLHSGWNLIAPCVDTVGLQVPQVLASLGDRFDMVLGERGTYVVGLPPEFQSLREIVPPWAYYARVQGSTSVALTQVAPVFDPQTPVALARGWRWVGYCVGSSLPIPVALGSIAGQYDMVLGERGAYVAGLPDEFQSLRQMDLGAGYMVRMTADGVLTYPAGGLVAGAEEPRSGGAEELGCQVQPSPYVTLAYGQVLLNGAPAPAGTLVEAVTPGGQVAGCFQVQEAGYFGLMPVYGADADGITPGFREGEPLAWRVNGQLAAAAPEHLWADDKEAHELSLTAGATGAVRVFLPAIAK